MSESIAAMKHTDTEPMAVPGNAASVGTVPLAVDLDGTLIGSDAMAESLIVLMHKSPLQLLRLPLWLAGGRAQFKSRLARIASPAVATLPYRRPVLELLQEERSKGRELVLATGTNEALASKVAQHVGLFDRTIASDEQVNLTGETKAQRLTEMFGVRGFDYVGNGWDDVPVWSQARKAILVEPGPLLRRRVAASTQIEHIVRGRGNHLESWLEEMRWQHWFKNVLLFVPLIAAHHLYDFEALVQPALAFAAFCLCASSIYLFNDLADLPSDRSHPVKKLRPLASGRVSIRGGVLLQAFLLVCALALGSILPAGFLATIGIYFVLQVAYSLQLKHVAYLDALVLATGYSLRIVAGAAAAETVISPWPLAVAQLFFFGLALLKRYAELVAMHMHFGQQTNVRGYALGQNSAIYQVGTASGYLAVLVLALYGYLLEEEGLHFVAVVALCVFLLVWTMHVWRMARLGRITGDPVVFVCRDRTSQLLAVVTVAAVLFSG